MGRIKKIWGKTPAEILVLLAIVFAVEIFIFNYRHWESFGNVSVKAEEIRLGDGYLDNGNGTFTVGEGNLEMEVGGIEGELCTSQIVMTVLNGQTEDSPISIRQWVTDESHRLYYELPRRELWEKEKRSSYMTYHLYGDCTGLKILPDLALGEVISFEVTLNPQIPLFLSWERMAALLLLSGILWALRSASRLHVTAYIGLRSDARSLVLVSFFLIHAILFLFLTHVNPYFQEATGDNQKQYHALAESFKEGSFSLLEEPSAALQNMENPYDYEYRTLVMSQSGEWYKWDHAYYNGKYYVYFGVVPAALFYFPYYMLTGVHLHTHELIFFLSLLFLAGIMGTVHQIIDRWFPQASLAMWILLMELILLGSGVVYMTKRPDLYTVPILSGAAFGMLGLWCFFLAAKGGEHSLKYLSAGALCTALTAGCRPQLFVFILFGAALFWKDLASGALVRTKWGKRAVAAFLLPMAAVAGMLMYYNYSRFGNVFDFGANYNLTFNDMRNRGWQWDRVPLGIVAYLFQPIKLIAEFPFTQATYFDSQYMGITIQEATYGGIFMTNLFSLFSILPLLSPRQMKVSGKAPWLFSLAGLLGAGMIIVADTNMSGILQRYFGDFSVFLMLSSAVSALMICNHPTIKGGYLEKAVTVGLLVCFVTGLAYQGMTFFLDTGEALRELRPDLYSHVKYLTAFWL
ncbi:MAG: hypothetical protein K2O16_13035 [Lachnospiraceae bacterium]|nr:hypothetical protein [Lachnospiraceae bacterium]